jgi:formate hydrogenlyase subunit 6/NADH:ubiquinone oxidoreductase subunit I
MKSLAPDQLAGFFAALEATHEVRLPILLPDGTRALGHPGDGPLALHGGPLPRKPTAAFFPHEGPVFTATDGTVSLPPTPEKPLLIAGFTHHDLACLRFIDRFFADGWRDDLYFRRRQGAVIVGASGYCGSGGTLLPYAGGECDLELVWDRARWLVVTYTEAGEAIASGLTEVAPDGTLERIREESAALVDGNESIIRRASELIRADRVPDEFWAEIGDRCIACTGCNLACPTCTCFGVQDWRYAERVERSRMWDSCQLDGFMREASGHNPLGTEALRTRRRIHHKLAADPERWGEVSCFVCGRCDAVCPTGIGIFAVVRELVARYNEA